jgi:hypothetical protein
MSGSAEVVASLLLGRSLMLRLEAAARELRNARNHRLSQLPTGELKNNADSSFSVWVTSEGARPVHHRSFQPQLSGRAGRL